MQKIHNKRPKLRLLEDVPYAGTNQIRLKGQHLWTLSQPAPLAPLHSQFFNCPFHYTKTFQFRLVQNKI